MTIKSLPKCLIDMFDRFSSAKKIPLDPPLTKGDVFWAGLFPLFEKEGLGEIYDYSNRQRIRP
jgi:hypothetical protein